MLIATFALIGFCAGIVLEEIIALLAVPPDGLREDDEGREPVPILGAESGTLMVMGRGIDWRRQLVVMTATSALFALVAARYEHPADATIVCAYVSVLLVCAGTDLLSFRVPNVVTYPAILAAIVLGVVMPGANIWEVLAGGGLAGIVLFVPALLTGGSGMGMGDVKLATFVGLSIGFTYAAPAMLIMALSGGAIAAFLLVTGLRGKGEPIPYAPFISIGALVVLLWQGTAFAVAG